jgi:stage II sporulation protein D
MESGNLNWKKESSVTYFDMRRLCLFSLLLLISSNLFASIPLRKYSRLKANILKNELEPKIRVRIGNSIEKVRISGRDLKRKFIKSNSLKQYRGRKKIIFNCKNISKRKKRIKPVLVASLSTKSGLIAHNLQKYQGDLFISTSFNSKSCDVVNETSLEHYISTLLAKEMNSSWYLEALKAQAIAARTYAIHKMMNNHLSKSRGRYSLYDIESSERHQVGGNFYDATIKTDQASRETRGVILITKKDKLITPAFYHAKCGGRTLLPDHVWDNPVAGYKGVRCPYCKDHGQKEWTYSLRKDELRKILTWGRKKGFIKNRLKNIREGKLYIVPDRMHNYNLRVYLGDKVVILKKTLFRKYLGRSKIMSNDFLVTSYGGSYLLKGRGLGHGVGMCQLGALNLASKGWTYKQILTHYFPKHTFYKIY